MLHFITPEYFFVESIFQHIFFVPTCPEMSWISNTHSNTELLLTGQSSLYARMERQQVVVRICSAAICTYTRYAVPQVSIYQDLYVRMEYIGTATSCIFNRTAVQHAVFKPGMLYHTQVCTRYGSVVNVVTWYLPAAILRLLLLLHAVADALYWCCSI